MLPGLGLADVRTGIFQFSYDSLPTQRMIVDNQNTGPGNQLQFRLRGNWIDTHVKAHIEMEGAALSHHTLSP